MCKNTTAGKIAGGIIGSLVALWCLCYGCYQHDKKTKKNAYKRKLEGQREQQSQQASSAPVQMTPLQGEPQPAHSPYVQTGSLNQTGAYGNQQQQTPLAMASVVHQPPPQNLAMASVVAPPQQQQHQPGTPLAMANVVAPPQQQQPGSPLAMASVVPQQQQQQQQPQHNPPQPLPMANIVGTIPAHQLQPSVVYKTFSSRYFIPLVTFLAIANTLSPDVF